MPTNEQLIERWENVLRVLRSLTPHQRRKHWDMSLFGVKTDCGTVACAMGHCGLDPWFRRRGLKLEAKKSSSMTEGVLGDLDTTFSGGREPTEIGPEFFGEDGYDSIFANSIPRSVGTVIREVRAHVRKLKGESSSAGERSNG